VQVVDPGICRRPFSSVGYREPHDCATAWPSKSLIFRRADDRFKPRCPDVSGTRSGCACERVSSFADSDLVSLQHGIEGTAIFAGLRRAFEASRVRFDVRTVRRTATWGLLTLSLHVV
jgi:hypothetical protein